MHPQPRSLITAHRIFVKVCVFEESEAAPLTHRLVCTLVSSKSVKQRCPRSSWLWNDGHDLLAALCQGLTIAILTLQASSLQHLVEKGSHLLGVQGWSRARQWRSTLPLAGSKLPSVVEAQPWAADELAHRGPVSPRLES